MVARGDEHLRAAVGKEAAQRVERVAVDAGAVEQVAGEQHRVAAAFAAKGAERLQSEALLLSAFGRALRR